MCVIAVSSKGFKFPSLDIFKMSNTNSDGIGITWIDTKGRANIKKGMMKLEEFFGFYSTMPITPHIIHFRMASVGGVTQPLTHPFAIRGNEVIDPILMDVKNVDLALTHNGHWSGWQDVMQTAIFGIPQIKLDGEWSDTRLMAEMLARTGVKHWGSFIPPGQRTAILTKEGQVWLHGQFTSLVKTHNEGMYVSNTYWKVGGYHTSGASALAMMEDEGGDVPGKRALIGQEHLGENWWEGLNDQEVRDILQWPEVQIAKGSTTAPTSGKVVEFTGSTTGNSTGNTTKNGIKQTRLRELGPPPKGRHNKQSKKDRKLARRTIMALSTIEKKKGD